eukprot:356055-Chlamydomonas_euryale.AAC.1
MSPPRRGEPLQGVGRAIGRPAAGAQADWQRAQLQPPQHDCAWHIGVVNAAKAAHPGGGATVARPRWPAAAAAVAAAAPVAAAVAARVPAAAASYGCVHGQRAHLQALGASTRTTPAALACSPQATAPPQAILRHALPPPPRPHAAWAWAGPRRSRAAADPAPDAADVACAAAEPQAAALRPRTAGFPAPAACRTQALLLAQPEVWTAAAAHTPPAASIPACARALARKRHPRRRRMQGSCPGAATAATAAPPDRNVR